MPTRDARDPRRRLATATAAELDALAVVTPAEIDDAARTWRADAPRGAAGRLDATVAPSREDETALRVAKADTGT